MPSLAGQLAPKQGSNVNLVRPTALNALQHRPIACWATTNVLGTYGGAAYTAAVATIKDQSGGGFDLAKTGTAATITQDAAEVDVFTFAATPTSYSRSDLLGLSGKPALTLAWRMKITADPTGASPNLIELGDSATHQDLNVFFDRNAGEDLVMVGDADASGRVVWSIAHLALDSEHTFVLTKDLGSDYGLTGWALYVDGALAPVSSAMAQDLTFSTGGTVLGDFAGGGFALVGQIPVLAVWDRALAGNDLAAVNEFLFYR